MKRTTWKITIASMLFGLTTFASAQELDQPVFIRPYPIDVTSNQTTVLVFPAAVIGADRGSADVLTRTVKDVPNVLKLKAAKPDVDATNVTVFTADGRLYSFKVQYNANPSCLAADLTVLNRHHMPAPLQFPTGKLNQSETADYARALADLKADRRRPRQKNGGISLSLQGLYIHQGTLFFKLRVHNSSPIPYELDFGRFYFKDRKRVKRTAAMEKELQPRYQYQNGEGPLDSGENRTIVVAFDQFTLGAGRSFLMELFEQNGDRHLSLRLSGKELLDAKTILPQTTAASE